MLRFSGGKVRPIAEDDAESSAAEPQTDEHAGAGAESPGRAGERHDDEARRIEHGVGEHDPAGAELVGEHARDGLRRAPHQVLQRERESEGLPAPAPFHGDRLQKQPEAVAGAQGEQQHQPAARKNDDWRGPVGAHYFATS